MVSLLAPRARRCGKSSRLFCLRDVVGDVREPPGICPLPGRRSRGGGGLRAARAPHSLPRVDGCRVLEQGTRCLPPVLCGLPPMSQRKLSKGATMYKAPPRVRRVRWLVCLCIAVFWIASIPLFKLVRSRALILGLPVIPVIGVYVWERRLAKRARQQIKQGAVSCWQCGYCLAGLPDDNDCPECGLSDAPVSSRRLWAEFSPLDCGKITRVFSKR